MQPYAREQLLLLENQGGLIYSNDGSSCSEPAHHGALFLESIY